MKDMLCIDSGHSHHQFGLNLVGFYSINFTVYLLAIGLHLVNYLLASKQGYSY